MGVQKFNFAHKFPKVGDFQPQILYFASLEESFMTGQFFFGGGVAPRHDATDIIQTVQNRRAGANNRASTRRYLTNVTLTRTSMQKQTKGHTCTCSTS